jgi:hypothetical protein
MLFILKSNSGGDGVGVVESELNGVNDDKSYL